VSVGSTLVRGGRHSHMAVGVVVVRLSRGIHETPCGRMMTLLPIGRWNLTKWIPWTVLRERKERSRLRRLRYCFRRKQMSSQSVAISSMRSCCKILLERLLCMQAIKCSIWFCAVIPWLIIDVNVEDVLLDVDSLGPSFVGQTPLVVPNHVW
jgi:hypothetical protein